MQAETRLKLFVIGKRKDLFPEMTEEMRVKTKRRDFTCTVV
jgi:hypothetical protein